MEVVKSGSGKKLEGVVRINHIDPPILQSIMKAVVEAQKKHGDLVHDPVRALVILQEEIGECAPHALAVTRASLDNESKGDHFAMLWHEMCQVAATAILYLDMMQVAKKFPQSEKGV